VVALCFWNLSCKGSSAESDDARAIAIADGWFLALTSSDLGGLAGKTAFPFWYRTTAQKKRCEGEVKDTASLQSWVACLGQKDSLILENLHHTDHLKWTANSDPSVSAGPLVDIVGRLDSSERLVRGGINGDGLFLDVGLIVSGGRKGAVRALLIYAEAEEN
jgi:hypothetical protein